jgi:hypothetical protein
VQEQQQPPAQAAAVVQMLQGMQAGVPDLKSLLEENRQTFRAVLISELHFCRSACRLTKEQSQRIAHKAGALVEPVAAESARRELNAAKRGGIRPASEAASRDPVKLVREIIQKLVNEYATPVQQGRYQAETNQRAAHRRETAIHALVARLDRMLILSSTQRERFLKMLESNWKEEWGVVSSVMDDDDRPLPAIPDKLVFPCLSANQQKIWSGLDRQAIDATEAYVDVVAEIMEGLPSEFTASLDAAARQAEKPPAPEMKKVNVDQKAR